ncbi:hypothetical protein D3C86_1907120 [compost metagenome]
MTFGFQAARGIDRYPTAHGEITALGTDPALPQGRQAEIFRLNDLAHRRGVMDLGDLHVLRA